MHKMKNSNNIINLISIIFLHVDQLKINGLYEKSVALFREFKFFFFGKTFYLTFTFIKEENKCTSVHQCNLIKTYLSH